MACGFCYQPASQPASQPPSHNIMPLKSYIWIYVLFSLLLLLFSVSQRAPPANQRSTSTDSGVVNVYPIYLSIYLSEWENCSLELKFVRTVCISKRNDYDICLECSMKMNELWEGKKSYIKGVSTKQKDFSIESSSLYFFLPIVLYVLYERFYYYCHENEAELSGLASIVFNRMTY